MLPKDSSQPVKKQSKESYVQSSQSLENTKSWYQIVCEDEANQAKSSKSKGKATAFPSSAQSPTIEDLIQKWVDNFQQTPKMALAIAELKNKEISQIPILPTPDITRYQDIQIKDLQIAAQIALSKNKETAVSSNYVLPGQKYFPKDIFENLMVYENGFDFQNPRNLIQ